MNLIGLARIGRDAELKYTAGGDPIANLTLAFNYGKKDGDGKQPSQWVDATLFGKRAESLTPYLLKGQQVLVHLDDPHVHTFDKKDGTKGSVLKGFVSKIEFAGPKPDATPKPAPAPKPKATAGGFEDMDSDIPF